MAPIKPTRVTATLSSPPAPGYCHRVYCGQRSTLLVQVKRFNGEWTSGIDYCERHAHDFAAGMTLIQVRVQPL